jgi:hypothetical protein
MRQAALALAFGALAAATPAAAQDHRMHEEHMKMMDAAMLTVTADAQVRRAPDLASINLGVSSRADTASAAMEANGKQMTAVMAALKKVGVADKDIQTATLNLSQEMIYNNNEPPKPGGYTAMNQLNIQVRDLKKLGSAIDASVNAGANQIYGVTFSVQKADEALDDARREAVKKARTRAELYAAAAGLTVERIVSISEGGGAAPPMPYPVMAKAEMAGGATPVAPGEVELGVQVTVIFRLK